MSNNYSRGSGRNENTYENRGRGFGRGFGRGRFGNHNGRGKDKFRRSDHNNNGKKENNENKKGISFKYEEPKEQKEFKISLGTTNKEKVNIPIYDDHSKHETMFILIKRFNIMVDDGDLFLKRRNSI